MSVPSPDQLAEAERWLDGAKEELAAAAWLVSATGLPGRFACFNAHLAAEKALKSLIQRRGLSPPNSHNLFKLRGLLPQVERERIPERALHELNPWVIRGRYPRKGDRVGPAVVSQLLVFAEEIVAIAARTDATESSESTSAPAVLALSRRGGRVVPGTPNAPDRAASPEPQRPFVARHAPAR